VGHSKLKIASVVTLAALLLSAPGTTSAQESYPKHPIKLIFPYVPGSLGDVLARLVAEKLTIRFGQPVIVENRPGASGNIGAEVVARAAPDGYTLLIAPPAARRYDGAV
jgi:tripartite-type tricarboxylate transporter receptor subunit TctC